MSIFWGSPRVDERRRRRLAADAGTRRGRGSSTRRGGSKSSQKGASQLPFSLSEIIPASPLVHFLTLVCGIGIAVTFPLLGYYDTQLAKWTGPIIARLFYLGTFPLARWYGMILLFGTAQLSLLIFWGRSHSQTDFRGSYRMWRNIAIFMLFDSVMLLNRGHLMWSKTLLHFWPEKIQGHETLIWVAPAIGLGYWVTRKLFSEMRDCWSSRGTIALSALFHLASVADLLDQRFVPATWTPQLLEALRLGALLTGQTCLFCGVLFHARHVVYVSIEPPVERYDQRGILGLLFAGLFSLVTLGWLRAMLASAQKSRSKANAASKSRSSRRAARQVEETEAAEEEEVEEESEEDETPNEESNSRQQWSKSGNRDIRIDEAENAADESHAEFSRDDLRGLSKKERRKLLMQQREEERRRGS